MQDYLYLVHFARASALAAYKADTIEDISTAAAMVGGVQSEMKMHLEYCKKFGLEREEIERTEEDQGMFWAIWCGSYVLLSENADDAFWAQHVSHIRVTSLTWATNIPCKSF